MLEIDKLILDKLKKFVIFFTNKYGLDTVVNEDNEEVKKDVIDFQIDCLKAYYNYAKDSDEVKIFCENKVENKSINNTLLLNTIFKDDVRSYQYNIGEKLHIVNLASSRQIISKDLINWSGINKKYYERNTKEICSYKIRHMPVFLDMLFVFKEEKDVELIRNVMEQKYSDFIHRNTMNTASAVLDVFIKDCVDNKEDRYISYNVIKLFTHMYRCRWDGIALRSNGEEIDIQSFVLRTHDNCEYLCLKPLILGEQNWRVYDLSKNSLDYKKELHLVE